MTGTGGFQPTDVMIGPGPQARALVARGRSLEADLHHLLALGPVLAEEAIDAVNAMRDHDVQAQLAAMPLARLKETTQGRVRIPTLEAAGYRTLASVIQAGPLRLQQVPGIGEISATQAVAAARQVETGLRARLRPRFDVVLRPPAHTRALRALRAVELERSMVPPLRDLATGLAQHLAGVFPDAEAGVSRLRSFLSGSARKERTRQAQVTLLRTLEQAEPIAHQVGSAASAIRSMLDDAAQWSDYEARSVAYNGLLAEFGGFEPDLDAAQGHLPADIVRRVEQQPLDTSLLGVSLRGYQSFGARFVLAQQRTILGDEMGLGKTIEALAAICHLHATGAERSLVVCPASVLVNWCHEIERRSELAAWRIHGSDRRGALRSWREEGGVAVTTYEVLKALDLPAEIQLGLLVVDEAHYVKNPLAARTRAVAALAGRVEHVLLLTGTPMENRVDEFKTLVGHLRPDIARHIDGDVGLGGADPFRTTVAPVYLRRNQEDVLTELPARIDAEAWVSLEGADLAAYRDAVVAGNFMQMRRAAYQPGTVGGSSKLARLVEIVEEAASNGQKVVVFSYFRDVLDAVGAVLGDRAMGPLHGGVPATRRQELVDAFSAHPDPKVLVCQIEAGGVGLNIQAASVVVLAEPQWKPTTEAQAIARCHRMGQVRRVEVHRLLAESTVDERMLQILARKAALFDEYARLSSVKEASPESVDVSDLDAVGDAINQSEAEREIIESERRRLQVPPPRSAT